MNSKTKELANEYYEFTRNYDEIMEKYSSNTNQDVRYENKSLKKLVENINESITEDYKIMATPWTFMPDSKRKILIYTIFSESPSLTFYFLKPFDMLCSNLESCIQYELENYYNNKGVFKSDNEIIDEVFKLEETGKFDKSVFSQETIDIYNLYKKGKKLEKKLFNYIKNNRVKKEKDYEL